MGIFDIFSNSLFQQEMRRDRRQNEHQAACDELEAEVYINLADEVEDECQNGVWLGDYDGDCQDDCGYIDDYVDDF